MEKLNTITPQALKGFLTEKYLNPLKCDLSFQKCHIAFYYVIGMIALYLLIILFTAHKYSNISLFIITLCLGIIIIGCTLILLNLCYTDSPSLYSYVTLGVSTLLSFMVITFFRK
jgi:hypothetical protein